MSGPELHEVGERARPLQRCVQVACRAFHRPLHARGALEQIGTSNVTDEDEVARQQPDRRIARGFVSHEEGDVLRGVSGHVQHVQSHCSDADFLPRLEPPCAGEGVTPINRRSLPFTRQQQLGVRRPGQCGRTGEEVGVDVRLGHGSDAESLEPRGLDVRCRIAQRIDDDGFFGALAGDDVAGLGELVVIETAKEHDRGEGRRRLLVSGWETG
jgi:hypothetical protein